MNIDKMDINNKMADVIQQKNEINTGNKTETTHKEKEQQAIKNQPAAVYEKGNKNNTARTIYNKNTVQKLKEQTENNRLKLIQIVQDSITRQNKKVGIANLPMITDIDAQARKEAEAMLAEDGELGVEKTSQRLVDFAKAISGGDKSKADLLRNAIDKGFKEAERMLGGKLPKISQDTYDRTMELFDAWAKSDDIKPENIEVEETEKAE